MEITKQGDYWFYRLNGNLSQPYRTKKGAEVAHACELKKTQYESVKCDVRLEQILSVLGSSCCVLAFKMSYCSSMRVCEISALLELDECSVEQAIQAGEYFFSYLNGGTGQKIAKDKIEKAVEEMFS